MIENCKNDSNINAKMSNQRCSCENVDCNRTLMKKLFNN